MYIRTLLVTTVLAALAGCSSYHELQPVLPQVPHVRIALIGDTQLTTDKLKGDYYFRSSVADGFVNVSVRSPAIEHLANENLQNILASISSDDADMVLYLGDGANSGCEDEVNAFFESLRSARARSGLPIFFAVGNHDYLGTGNQTNESVRRRLCGGLPFYDKWQLIEMTAKFNAESAASPFNPGFIKSYTDSTKDVQAACTTIVRKPVHSTGCFYAAYVTLELDGKPGDLLITDTSDYRDIFLKPALGNNIELFGYRGAISFKSDKLNQVDWYRNQDGFHNASYRFIASHFPVNDLRLRVLFLKFDASGRAGSLLLDNGQNVWLSAHTHTATPVEELKRTVFSGGELTKPATVFEANVGSTTDYPPHFMVLTKDQEERMKKQIRYLPLRPNGLAACEPIYEEVEAYIAPHEAYGAASGMTALGMSTEYRNFFLWHRDRQSELTITNLKAFLDRYGQPSPTNYERQLAVSCIMVKSSELEHDHWITRIVQRLSAIF